MGLYIPYRGTLTEPGHDAANKRITTIVTAVTATSICSCAAVPVVLCSYNYKTARSLFVVICSCNYKTTPEFSVVVTLELHIKK